LDAIAVVDQSDAPQIVPGTRAYLAIDQQGSGSLLGTVNQLARAETDDLPLHLAATGAIPRKVEAGQSRRPLPTVYQVRIQLDDPASSDLLPGALGRTRIVAIAEPLHARLSRWLAKTFRFHR